MAGRADDNMLSCSIGIRDYRVLEGRQRVGRIRFVIERMPGVWLWNVTVHLSKVQSVDQRMRLGMRCRLSPTADVPSHTSGQRCAKSRHPSRDGTFADRVVTSSIDPCRSWVYNLRPRTPPWQLGQGRLERLLYLLYGEYAEDGGPRDSHATTHPVCQ